MSRFNFATLLGLLALVATFAQTAQPLTDADAKLLEAQWKAAFPDATLLPVIGLPSYDNSGVATLSHTLGDGVMSIDGLPSNSALANYALYSAEVSRGVYLNLYEIMLPDIPGTNGSPSTTEVYVRALNDCNTDGTITSGHLSVAGNHYHWQGAFMIPEATGIFAIHHQGLGVNPQEFSKCTINAINDAVSAIAASTGM